MASTAADRRPGRFVTSRQRAGTIHFFLHRLRIFTLMARWPQRTWTTIFTYAAIFIGFPLLCLLAYAYVQGWLF